MSIELKKIDEYRWELPPTEKMRVKAIIYTDEKMLSRIQKENAVQQLKNVASLPGIVKTALAMPDIHWGYGFPIGGVAAFAIEEGVISPGGIGYDINCGMRLLRTNLRLADIQTRLSDLIRELFRDIPAGVGSEGKLHLKTQDLLEVLSDGAEWALKHGFGNEGDLGRIEEGGKMTSADPEKVSQRAKERGRGQLGTLGAGNHFLEIQVVDKIYDEARARDWGIFPGQILVMIHTGSRGLGYQVCDDYIEVLQSAVKKYGIEIADRQLVCAPVNSPEGKNYFQAMSAAANFAFANRQIIAHWVREAFSRVLKKNISEIGMETVYDIAHNIGKLENHLVDGQRRQLLVHRKGATRAFPGQPIIIPGTMGTNSYLLVGTERAMEETFGSTCHGAGRVMSRTQALKTIRGETLKKNLENRGILVAAESLKTLAEETPEAYKNVDEVVTVCAGAGISCLVSRMKPVGVIKG